VPLGRVPAEDRILGDAVLQAGQVGGELVRSLRGESIDHPIRLLPGLDESVFAQVGEMLGDLDLRLPQNLLKVTDAEVPAHEEVQYPQTRLIAKALIYRN
jgi:hypothetical protein